MRPGSGHQEFIKMQEDVSGHSGQTEEGLLLVVGWEV